MEQTNIKVIIKPRPRIQREKDDNQHEQWSINGNTIECRNPLINQHRYTFDKIYHQTATNDELYENEVQPIVEQVINGYHGTIFAYGQTSSGKTYTMVGTKQNPGIIRKAAGQIFDGIRRAGDGKMFLIKVNYLEIYNEKVYNLLGGRKELKLNELPNGELNIEDGQEVKDKEEIIQIIDNGNVQRKCAETKMNVQSSRSHAVLQIVLQQIDENDSTLVSVLNLVDLAGSERAEQTGATGERLKEAGNINKSLLTLSRVIEQLSEKRSADERIPYRDSKLTRMLQNSLGGNSMTAIICAITLAAGEETNNTLGFAMRAKKIENKPIVNEVVSDAVEVKRMKKKISDLEANLKKHKDEIEKYQRMQAELNFLNTRTIRSSSVKNSQRRQTWGGDVLSLIPVHVDSPSFKTGKATEAKCNGGTQEIKTVDENGADAMSTSTFKIPSKVPMTKRSLLAAPTSFRSPVHRTNSTTTMSTASPIALDKDKRIKALEAEIAELQHFQATELTLKHQENLNTQAEVEKKVAEIADKTLQLKEADSERAAAIKAKALAEQKMVSLEYEYEQHKERAMRREKELLDELQSLNNDETVRILKEKLQTMTTRANSFETQIWQNQNKHTAELEAANREMDAKQDEIKVLTDRLAKVTDLQKEYDEVSVQMMGYIEENDELKMRCAELEKNRLNIGELKAKDDELMGVKREFNALLAEYDQLEHNNNISISAFNQARMTIDCFKKECDILRNALAEAQAILAQQELDNLKLQKSICEYNDTINFSQLNETSNNNNNNTPLIEMTAQLDKANAECEMYASKLEAITARLSMATGIEVTPSSTNIDDYLEKILTAYNEFINIERYVNSHESAHKVSSVAQSIIEQIQSQFDRSAALEQSNVITDNELKSLKETVNQMENAKLENDRLISGLQSEIQSLLDQIVQLTSNENKLKQNVTETEMNAKNEINRLQRELNDLLKAKEYIDSERNQLIDQFNDMKKKMEDTKCESEQTISNLQAKVQSLSIELERFTSKENELIQNVNESEMKAKIEIARLQKELTAMTNAEERTDSERKQLIDQLNVMEKNVQNIKFESEKTITNLLSKVDQLTCNEKELKENVSQTELKAKNEIAGLQNELIEIRKAKDGIDLERKHLIDQLNSMSQRMEDTKHENETTISNLQAKVQSLSIQLEQFTSEGKELIQNVNEREMTAKNEIARLQIELAEMVKAKDSVYLERKHLIEQLNIMEKKMKDTKFDNEQTITNLQVKVQSLSTQLDQLASSKKEMKQKVEEMEMMAKNETAKLQKELTDMEKSKNCIDLERKQLLDQLNTMNKKLEDTKHEAEKTITNLQSKVQTMTVQINQLDNNEKELKECVSETELKAKNDIARLQNDLTDMKNAKDSIELERKKLVDQLNVMETKKLGESSRHTKKSLSPRHDQSIDMEKLRAENRNLHKQQQQLEEEIDQLRKSTNCDRKKKRQSVHDDTRRISGFDATMIDIEVQTDPVDQKCACIDLNKKIDRLTQEKIIIEAKLQYQCEISGVTELKAEVKSLQTKIDEYKLKLSQTTYHYEDMRTKYQELKIKADMIEEMQKTVTTDAFAQTEPMTGATFVEQMDWDRVNRRAELYKTEYQKCVHAYNDLKDKYKKQVEQNAALKAQHDQTLAKCNELQMKYDKAKELCMNRFESLGEYEAKMAKYIRKIDELNQNETKLKDELAALKQLHDDSADTVANKELKSKYDELSALHAKNLTKCRETANALDDFKEKYGRIKMEVDSLKQQSEELLRIKDKYSRLKKQILDVDAYRTKYDSAKEVLVRRFHRIKYLEAELGRYRIQFTPYTDINDENVSNNQLD